MIKLYLDKFQDQHSNHDGRLDNILDILVQDPPLCEAYLLNHQLCMQKEHISLKLYLDKFQDQHSKDDGRLDNILDILVWDPLFPEAFLLNCQLCMQKKHIGQKMYLHMTQDYHNHHACILMGLHNNMGDICILVWVLEQHLEVKRHQVKLSKKNCILV